MSSNPIQDTIQDIITLHRIIQNLNEEIRDKDAEISALKDALLRNMIISSSCTILDAQLDNGMEPRSQHIMSDQMNDLTSSIKHTQSNDNL